MNNTTTPYKTTPEILVSFKKGDHNAFDEIFIAYYQKVKNFIFQIIKNRSTSEKLACQLFAELWKNRHEIDPDTDFGKYFYRMARNQVIDYISVKNDSSKVDKSKLNHSHSSDIVMAKEMGLLLSIMKDRMPKFRRRIFELYHDHNMTVEKIALELDKAPRKIQKRLDEIISEIRCLLLSMLSIIY